MPPTPPTLTLTLILSHLSSRLRIKVGTRPSRMGSCSIRVMPALKTLRWGLGPSSLPQGAWRRPSPPRACPPPCAHPRSQTPPPRTHGSADIKRKRRTTKVRGQSTFRLEGATGLLGLGLGATVGVRPVRARARAKVSHSTDSSPRGHTQESEQGGQRSGHG